MCGIFGLYNIQKYKQINDSLVQSCLKTMIHRGPDHQSFKKITDDLIFGHVRLSIIDLNEENNQPFEVDDKYSIIFNGEIYNYLELREELLTHGYSFKTKGDTEVLLRSYHHWGESCVTKFNGMWAFAIYDHDKQKLFCSRDRFGVKPFNYALVNGQLIFSSEIKGIINYFPELKVPNYNVIANYCRTSIGAQIKETWFENVFRLEPAHNIVVQEGKMKIYRYWDYPRKVDTTISFEQALVKYKKIFKEAVSLRMRSDVPVGFTLSSGIDSSSLVCSLNDSLNLKTNTYTASYTGNLFKRSEKANFKTDVEIDEPSIVKRLTNDLEMTPTIVEVPYDMYVNDLKKIIHYMESGHSSPAVFPLFHVLNIAKKDVTVILEGQGADELLGGYISNITPVYIWELITKIKFKKAIITLSTFAKIYSLRTTMMLIVRRFNNSLINKIFFRLSGQEALYVGKIKNFKYIKDFPVEPTGFDSLSNEHLFKAHTGGLVNLLHYGDAISMAHSLESRLPFMDYRLVEFVFTLPAEFKLKYGMGKFIHRKAMKGIVPDYILKNKIKFGFDSPLAHLFCEDGINTPKGILLSNTCISRGLFSKKNLQKAFEEQKRECKDHSRILYRMLSVELWFREFIDNENE
jgi:asparagine synthase (glutamine-hydrolysing)